MTAINSSFRIPLGSSAPAPARADAIAAAIYRRFFLGGIITVLSVGATWGAWILLQIGRAGKFNGVSLQDVNAHGQAQIYGWMGLFIMGFAYQVFPRIWFTDLAAPRLAAASFAAMLSGLVLRSIGMIIPGAPAWAVIAAVGGCVLQAASILTFAAQIILTFRRSLARMEPYIGFIFAALAWFIAMILLDTWHTCATLTAATPGQLLWHVATYQAPLRDLQVHGLALFMILGVCLRKLPPMYGCGSASRRRAWAALLMLILAVLGEVGIFIAYRWSGNHAIAALLMIPWLMLAIGVAMIVLPWKPWRRFARTDRSAKFIRTAFAWLALSLAMLLLLPAYQAVTRIPFSHAYYGAIRHAITVGFVSLMIMGFAARVVPTLSAVDPATLPSLRGPFTLINLGCALRVSLQTFTDWHPAAYHFVGVSGILEVSALAWWGYGLIAIMLANRNKSIPPGCPSRRFAPPPFVPSLGTPGEASGIGDCPRAG